MGTAVERELINLFQRGGVIAGSSAGAAVLSRTMIAKGNSIPVIDQGFNLIPNAIIDQHFLKRNRMNRLRNAVIAHPNLVGIGIDETTAIQIQNDRIKVFGNSYVVLITMQQHINQLNIQIIGPDENLKLCKLFDMDS